MILCEFKTFTTDTETYTKEVFEKIVGDEFDAMMYEDHHHIPAYIWTTNFVVIVKQNARGYSDVSFGKIPRNPVCE